MDRKVRINVCAYIPTHGDIDTAVQQLVTSGVKKNSKNGGTTVMRCPSCINNVEEA